MDRLRVMEVFARVVESGSFSAAGRDLGIGQPAVSKMVAELEERLHVRLLARSTRRITPTEAGVAFYERAVRALAEADEADAAAQGLGAGLEGRLRICAPVTFARLHLVPKLSQFLEAHPRLRLEVIHPSQDRRPEQGTGSWRGTDPQSSDNRSMARVSLRHCRSRRPARRSPGLRAQ